MKKIFLTVGLITMSGAAFAQQGYVYFNAAQTPANPYVVTNTAISPLFGGSGLGGVSGLTIAGTGAGGQAFYYALLVSGMTSYGVPSADTAVWDGTWTYTGIMSSNSVVAGRVWPGSALTYVGSIVNNLGQTWNGNGESMGGADGVTNSIVLVGWSANWGSSWSEVSADLAAYAAGGSAPSGLFFGESTIGYLVPNYITPGAAIFGSAADANGLPIYNPSSNPMELYAVPVPEPGTMALVGLGGLSLLLFRRRI